MHREAVERIIDVVELETIPARDGRRPAFRTAELVGFARALALEPSIMLLDEPSAGLNRRNARTSLASSAAQAPTWNDMIWIEHDMQMIADLADRIHVLDYGRTIAEGTPGAVLTNPDVLSSYLGTADVSAARDLCLAFENRPDQ
jgi:branched-chain amino acid transport system ATP-binding protein